MDGKTFFADDKFDSVIEALQNRGYTRVPDSRTDCQVLWTNLKNVDHDQCHHIRWVNHFKGAQHFSNKAYLAYHLFASRKLSTKFFPATWSPAIHEAEDLLRMLLQPELAVHAHSPLVRRLAALLSGGLTQTPQGDSNVWIVKPVGLSCGQNIRICRGIRSTLECVQAFNYKCVVQQYIARPLLVLSERKFDVRQWVLVVSLDPLVVYGFSECYARLSSQPFSLEEDRLADPLVHLCNHAIQKLSGTEAAEGGTMMSQPRLAAELDRVFASHDFFHISVLPQIKTAVLASIASVREKLSDPAGNGFEWLGYDLMMEDTGNVQLIEVNTSPDLSYSTSTTTPLVTAAVDDCFELLMVEFEAMGWKTSSVEQRRAAVRQGLIPRQGLQAERSLRWDCWLAEEEPPPSAWEVSRAKKAVAVLKTDYVLRDAQLLHRAVECLAQSDHSAPSASNDVDDDEF